MTIKVRSVHWSADEWIAGTQQLTLVERGLYDTIINLIYSKGGPIDDDERWLARCSCSDRRTVRAALRRLVELGKVERLSPVRANNGSDAVGGKLMNRRCAKELERALHRATSSRSAADRSANARRSLSDRRR